MQRTLFEAEHEEFRELVRTFVTKECQPHHEEWERAGVVDRSAWRRAGEMGLLGLTVPEQYGGAGLSDPRFDVIVTEELAFGGITGLGLSLHNELLAPYLVGLTTDEQKARWLPGYCSGETVTAIAMSEPGAGSDLRGIRTTALRDGDHFVVNGAKTFISNGLLADLVVVAVKTDPGAGRGSLSLLAVERATPGFERGRKLDKVGLRAQDTAELFFNDARVPAANLLGEEHRGLHYLMRNLAAERLSIAVGSVASARRAQELTRQYVRSRTAFGTTIGSFQNTRFVLAALHARTLAVQALVDGCVQARIAGTLTPEDAAAAKLLATELEFDAVDAGVQLHGGYGWMEEYPIARMYRDVRITRIFGGSSEIMKEVVGRALRLDDPTAP
ncbi:MULTISPECIES: acyl-CoA dehydrogenase family protein [Frankia]|uniref:Acyl-CoA dehydrogenase, long-chain specific n=2 Tax=Frankia TaxID=1854 RepID=Q0RL56_FRAAA|nr:MULTISPECIES: acyl-CoA dehydrogenase family protein [Frankia]CAJ61749.1 Acyl-CoA dehydrogenase, long-chain specific [Frankia alni ACN14a]